MSDGMKKSYRQQVGQLIVLGVAMLLLAAIIIVTAVYG